MKTAYFDCFSGVSGDMCLGALVDAGAPLPALKRELKKIPVSGYRLSLSDVMRSGLRAARLSVNVSRNTASPAIRLADVRRIIRSSGLSPDIKKKGQGVFQLLFEAEARAHGTTPGRAHLHELGAVDAMVDILGTVICLELIGVERVLCSPINLGSGHVETEHGKLPVPAPATAGIVSSKGVPVYAGGEGELATPTGAALMASLSEGFGPMPAMRVEGLGTGAGGRDVPGMPNALRVFIGEASRVSSGPDGWAEEVISVMECNMDDMSPELYPHVMELLFEAGALDVWLTPVIMKKTRPAVVLSAISTPERADALMEVILRETTTLGLRHYEAGRRTLERRLRSVRTLYGPLRVKDAFMDGRLLKSAPEYEDALALARKHRVPLRDVMNEALSNAGAARGRRTGKGSKRG